MHVSESWFSPGVMILPILCGGLLLWPRALRILFAIAGLGVTYDLVERKAGAPDLVTTMQNTVASGDDCALVIIWRT